MVWTPAQSSCRNSSNRISCLLVAHSFHLCIFSCGSWGLSLAQRRKDHGLWLMRSFHMAAASEPWVHAAHSPLNSAEAFGCPKSGPRNHRQQSRDRSPFTCEGTDALPGYVYMLEATQLERGAGLGSRQSDSPACLSHCPIQAVLTGKSLEEYSEFLTAILLRDIDLLTILTCSLFSLFTYSCPQPSYL